METSITDLRNHLKATLDSVRRGQEVTITDRGHPVARIVPISRSDELWELVNRGIVSRPLAPKAPISAEDVRVMPQGSVAYLVSELRYQ